MSQSRRITRSQKSNSTYQTYEEIVDIDDTADDDDDNIGPSTSSGLPRFWSQDSGERRLRKKSVAPDIKVSARNALSQNSVSPYAEENRRSLELANLNAQEQLDLAERVISNLFIMDKKKYHIQKANIVKNILHGNSKNFRPVMEKVKSLLSKVFGYKLIDIGRGKYILVNQIKNSIPHLNFKASIKAQQVLLFIILSHIFMQNNACREEILWNFLRCLGIVNENNFLHDYFGDVQMLVTVDFVAQYYLERVAVDKSDGQKYEYKWGIRAEHAVSRRDILEFMSEIYEGRSINSWPQQYKEMLQKEQSEEEQYLD